MAQEKELSILISLPINDHFLIYARNLIEYFIPNNRSGIMQFSLKLQDGSPPAPFSPQPAQHEMTPEPALLLLKLKLVY
ncbi:MAG: hypothetical protein RR944_12250 [Acinetobacter sp.]